MSCKENTPLIEEKSSATLWVIVLVAVTQGILGLSDLAVSFLYKDEFHLTPVHMSFLNSFCAIPWIIKPVWGFISDSVPIYEKRRAPYLALFGLVSAGCWVYMAKFVASGSEAAVVMFTVQVSTAFCNVIGEALVVEESQNSPNKSETASRYVTLFFGVRAMCLILTAYTGGLFLEIFSKRTIFLITACCPLLLCVASRMLQEKPVDSRVDIIEQVKRLLTVVRKPSVASPMLFIFLFMVVPTTADAMFYFYTNQLHFGPEMLGRLKMTHGFASVIGILMYNKWLRKVSFKRVFVWSSVLCAGAGTTQLLLVLRLNALIGIPDTVFCLFSGLIVQAIGEIASIPLLVLCCRICPKKVEGSMYALLMSTMNFGNLISYQLGSILMLLLGITDQNFSHLWVMIVIVYSIMLAPVPLLKLIPDVLPDEVKDEDGENGCDLV